MADLPRAPGARSTIFACPAGRLAAGCTFPDSVVC
jgi:hypothetical protein